MPRKPKPWFRFYVEAVHDRKLRRLKPETRWLFVACLAAARQSPRPGWLLVGEDDPMDLDDLADFAHMTPKQVERGTVDLTRAGVLAFDASCEAWYLPSWGERQYESDDVTARTRKHREKEGDPFEEGTTLERSNGDGRNGVDASKERLRSVTEAEEQRNFVPTEPDFSSSPSALARVVPMRLAGGWGA